MSSRILKFIYSYGITHFNKIFSPNHHVPSFIIHLTTFLKNSNIFLSDYYSRVLQSTHASSIINYKHYSKKYIIKHEIFERANCITKKSIETNITTSDYETINNFDKTLTRGMLKAE